MSLFVLCFVLCFPFPSSKQENVASKPCWIIGLLDLARTPKRKNLYHIVDICNPKWKWKTEQGKKRRRIQKHLNVQSIFIFTLRQIPNNAFNRNIIKREDFTALWFALIVIFLVVTMAKCTCHKFIIIVLSWLSFIWHRCSIFLFDFEVFLRKSCYYSIIIKL